MVARSALPPVSHDAKDACDDAAHDVTRRRRAPLDHCAALDVVVETGQTMSYSEMKSLKCVLVGKFLQQ